MNAPLESAIEEAARLRGCLNDLVVVMAIPELWMGSEPPQIVSTSLHVLVGMLHLDFAYVRLVDRDGGSPREIVQVPGQPELTSQASEITAALDRSQGDNYLGWPPKARLLLGGTEFSIAQIRLGLVGEIGVLVAGSQRFDFPSQTERLLLDVAANQVAIGLQQAHLLHEQKRIARELDNRVAQRTSELASANAELAKEVAERRRAEEALRESEHSSRLIVNSIPGFVSILAPTGEVEVVNPQIVEYCGRPLEELKQWGTSNTVHPEDLPRAAQGVMQSLASGEPYEFEARIRRFDGIYRWFQVRGRALRDTDGRILHWYSLLTDIDDMKRAENGLRASERKLKLIVDTIPALAWSARPDGTAEFFNRHYLDYLGLSTEQARDSGWTAAVHPHDLSELAATWHSILASEQPGETEVRLRRRDGEYRWHLFRVNPLRDESGEVAKWYGTNTEIHDRRRAEEELRIKEAFLAEGQRLSHTGSFSWYVDTDEVSFSDELYRIFEFEQELKVSLDLMASRVHPDDLPLLSGNIERARVAGGDFHHELRLKMPDGSVKYLLMIARDTRHPDGRREYLGAVQDVTARKLSDEALTKAGSELAQMAKVMSLGVLTASIAHEVNQPLSGIITNASTCLRMLGTDPPNIEGARETARRTIRDGNRASDMIARLRALFSKKGFTPESLDLNEATREVIALSSSDLQRSRVVLRLELANDLPPVTGDRIQLQQVVQNLVCNAKEAMTEIDDRPRHLVVRTERDTDDRVRLTVRDVGVGLQPHVMENLFQAFYTTKSTGMGIGLSLSRSIIESHQGRLWARSNEGPGATFSFSIPRDQGHEADAASILGDS